MSKEISDPKRLHFYSTNKSSIIQGGRSFYFDIISQGDDQSTKKIEWL